MSSDKIVCRHCQHENPPEALICANCGEALERNTTLPASGRVVDFERPPIDFDGRRVDDETLFFYVIGSSAHDPLTHQGSSSVILGRKRDESVKEDFINLSAYRAYELGVSRQHVRVDFHDGGYRVEDLNSANGTWLNGHRLNVGRKYPMQRGDHLQLGELIMFVYFLHPDPS